jgi:hypothetical protein
MVHATATWTIYLNGVSAATGTLTSTALSEYNALSGLSYCKTGNTADGTGPTQHIITAAEYGNVALTATEVGLLHAFGWAALPQYVHTAGAGLTLSTSVAENGYATSWETFTSSDATSLTASDTRESRTNIRVRFPATMPRGKAYRTKFTPTFSELSSMTMLGATGASFDLTAPTLVSGTAVDFLFTKSSADLTALLFLSNTSANDVAHTFALTGFSVVSAGLCGSWDFSQGAGYQQRDLSGAGNRMTLTTTGVSRLNPGDLLQVKATVAHGSSGNLQINGQAILPDVGWRLNSIVAESDASITAYVGNVSGGAQLVASVALTANVPKDLTIVSGAAVPTTVNAWSNSSGAANITYTLTYVRSDIT